MTRYVPFPTPLTLLPHLVPVLALPCMDFLHGGVGHRGVLCSVSPSGAPVVHLHLTYPVPPGATPAAAMIVVS